MNTSIIRASMLMVAALVGGQVGVLGRSKTIEPTAQEIADRHNRVTVEALTHEKEDTEAVVRFLSAISRSEAQPFVSSSDTELLRPRLKTGWEIALLGYLRKDGERIGLWAVIFDDGGEDLVVRLSVKSGKVIGLAVR